MIIKQKLKDCERILNSLEDSIKDKDINLVFEELLQMAKDYTFSESELFLWGDLIQTCSDEIRNRNDLDEIKMKYKNWFCIYNYSKEGVKVIVK